MPHPHPAHDAAAETAGLVAAGKSATYGRGIALSARIKQKKRIKPAVPMTIN